VKENKTATLFEILSISFSLCRPDAQPKHVAVITAYPRQYPAVADNASPRQHLRPKSLSPYLRIIGGINIGEPLQIVADVADVAVLETV